MGYTIDKNIPLPGDDGRRGRYPFGKMAVGDSILVEGTFDTQMKACNAARTYASRHKMKFTTKREGNGTRIWRSE